HSVEMFSRSMRALAWRSLCNGAFGKREKREADQTLSLSLSSLGRRLIAPSGRSPTTLFSASGENRKRRLITTKRAARGGPRLRIVKLLAEAQSAGVSVFVETVVPVQSSDFFGRSTATMCSQCSPWYCQSFSSWIG